MEKGKTLNPELQPANVDKNAATVTATVGGVGTVAGFLGGDPILMLQNVQNMVGSGQIGVPINPGMRDFMSKFSWANFAFFTPPPDFLTSLLVPDEYRGASAKRRLSDAATASGAESDEDEKPPSDLPDVDESGNAAFLRKTGSSADEYFIGIVMGVLLTPVSAVHPCHAIRIFVSSVTVAVLTILYALTTNPCERCINTDGAGNSTRAGDQSIGEEYEQAAHNCASKTSRVQKDQELRAVCSSL